MKSHRLLLVILLVGPGAFGAELSVRFCRAMNEWLSGQYNFQELCSRYEGKSNFCFHINAEGKAICAAAGGDYCDRVTNSGQGICYGARASLCSGVRTLGQGVCLALGETSCQLVRDGEDRKWLRKLEAACDTSARRWLTP